MLETARGLPFVDIFFLLTTIRNQSVHPSGGKEHDKPKNANNMRDKKNI